MRLPVASQVQIEIVGVFDQLVVLPAEERLVRAAALEPGFDRPPPLAEQETPAQGAEEAEAEADAGVGGARRDDGRRGEHADVVAGAQEEAQAARPRRRRRGAVEALADPGELDTAARRERERPRVVEAQRGGEDDVVGREGQELLLALDRRVEIRGRQPRQVAVGAVAQQRCHVAGRGLDRARRRARRVELGVAQGRRAAAQIEEAHGFDLGADGRARVGHGREPEPEGAALALEDDLALVGEGHDAARAGAVRRQAGRHVIERRGVRHVGLERELAVLDQGDVVERRHQQVQRPRLLFGVHEPREDAGDLHLRVDHGGGNGLLPAVGDRHADRRAVERHELDREVAEPVEGGVLEDRMDLDAMAVVEIARGARRVERP